MNSNLLERHLTERGIVDTHFHVGPELLGPALRCLLVGRGGAREQCDAGSQEITRTRPHRSLPWRDGISESDSSAVSCSTAMWEV